MLHPAAEFLGRRAKLHRDTGVAVGDLVVLQQEFANAGKAAEDIGPVFGKMAKTLNSNSAADTVAKLGIKLEELKKKTPSEQFRLLGTAINSVRDLSERATISMELFGRSGAKLLSLFSSDGFGDNVQPAPVGRGTYFWAAFAEHVAKAQNVPVLLLNAAFGGTSLEHWAKSARGEPFEHPFVISSIRMPYIRLEHALTKYCAATGLRAILADQGQNDWPEKDEEKIIANYKAWIEQARKDAGFPNLAVVVNRQSPPDGFGQIRRVQDRMIKEHPHCFPGADYDTLGKEDTTDKVHLSEAGEIKAARLWANALDADFFKAAVPWQPK